MPIDFRVDRLYYCNVIKVEPMKFTYRVMVTLPGGNLRVWYEEGNSSEKISDNILKVLDNCLVDYERVEVDLGR